MSATCGGIRPSTVCRTGVQVLQQCSTAIMVCLLLLCTWGQHNLLARQHWGCESTPVALQRVGHSPTEQDYCVCGVVCLLLPLELLRPWANTQMACWRVNFLFCVCMFVCASIVCACLFFHACISEACLLRAGLPSRDKAVCGLIFNNGLRANRRSLAAHSTTTFHRRT